MTKKKENLSFDQDLLRYSFFWIKRIFFCIYPSLFERKKKQWMLIEREKESLFKDESTFLRNVKKKIVCKEIFSLLRGTTTSPFFVKLFKLNLAKKKKSLIFVTASLFHTQCILIEFPQLFSHSSSWHFQPLSLFVIFYGFNYIAWWWWQSIVTLLKFNEKPLDVWK